LKVEKFPEGTCRRERKLRGLDASDEAVFLEFLDEVATIDTGE
jgi:hypothetical protein